MSQSTGLLGQIATATDEDALTRLWEANQGVWTDECTAAVRTRLVAVSTPAVASVRCRMCSKAAKVGSAYCGAKACHSNVRICQKCSSSFQVNRDGATTTHCSRECSGTKEAAGPAPRCRMCARPARLVPKTGQYAVYCSGNHCGNRDRLCQRCGEPFVMKTGEGGTKYCSLDCMELSNGRRAGATQCAWCARPAPQGTRVLRRSTWPYICSECIEPIKHVADRLKKHHVAHERAQELANDPRCEVCGIDVLAKVRRSTSDYPRARLVVDHDHGCCPGVVSCGSCVRGLLCGDCNAAAGMLRDNPSFARSLGEYLDRVRTTSSNSVVSDIVRTTQRDRAAYYADRYTA